MPHLVDGNQESGWEDNSLSSMGFPYNDQIKEFLMYRFHCAYSQPTEFSTFSRISVSLKLQHAFSSTVKPQSTSGAGGTTATTNVTRALNRFGQMVGHTCFIAHTLSIGISGNVLIDENADRVNSYNIWNYAEGNDSYYSAMLVDLTQPPGKASVYSVFYLYILLRKKLYKFEIFFFNTRQ